MSAPDRRNHQHTLRKEGVSVSSLVKNQHGGQGGPGPGSEGSVVGNEAREAADRTHRALQVSIGFSIVL